MLIFHKATVLSLVIGFIISLAGEMIRLWGVSWAGSETRTTRKVGGTFLIISGPFAHVRNPLYVGNILIYLGLGIMSFALFPYLQIAGLIYFFIQYYLIVKQEEKFLKEKFGKDFSEYLENVPAFFPRLIPYRNSKILQPQFKLKAGLRSERRSMQATIIVSLLTVVIWIIKTYL
jgi:protein-S-isoprenylcysteine O-methyltransferase Ste14